MQQGQFDLLSPEQAPGATSFCVLGCKKGHVTMYCVRGQGTTAQYAWAIVCFISKVVGAAPLHSMAHLTVAGWRSRTESF